MAKNSVWISFVAAFALLTIGCGGGGSGTAADNDGENNETNKTVTDTTPPVITTASEFNVTEETNSTVRLTATDDKSAVVTFSIPATANFDLNNSILKFSAPSYKNSGVNDYNVTVSAKDESNNTANKTLTFHVNPVKAKVAIVSTGDKNLSVNGDVITGPTGLKWLNVDTGTVPFTYDEAVTFCTGKGYRIARRDEILNLIDYTKGNGVDGNLLEDEFTEYQNKSESWALKLNDKYFYVNFVSGADGMEDDGTAQRSVLCVKGVSAPSHTFKAENNITTDKTTGLVWTNMVFDHSTRRAINPDANTNPQTPAKDSCPAGYELPNIAQLRSIVDYATNKVNPSIAPEGVSIIWSATADSNDGGIEKNYVLDTNNSLISTEETNLTYFVTCVKKK